MPRPYGASEAQDLNKHVNLGEPPRSDLPADTRGILDPVAMMRCVAFDRAPAGPDLDGVVEWFWSVAWDFPAGQVHDQEVLSHPAGNVSIGTIDDRGVVLAPAEGRVFGVVTGISHRHLTGNGWTVAARSSVGGMGVLLDAPAVTATDLQLDFSTGVPGIRRDVVAGVCEAVDNAERIALLREALADLVSHRDPAVVAEARQVAEVASIAEHDRSVCRVEHLAAAAGTSVRTLQRQFDRHVGVSPSFVIRRWRLIEAAESARVVIDGGGEWPGWAEVAATLGYADQAHLTRDFRRHLGVTPSAYLTRAAGDGGG